MFVLRRVINTNVGTLKNDQGLPGRSNKAHKTLTFLIKGFTAVRLEWIFKHIFTILIWKERHHPPTRGGYSYNHSAFMNLFGETLWLYGWVFTPLRYFTIAVLTSLRAGVTHRLLQLNEVN